VNFQEAYRELMYQTPQLPQELASRLVNRAWRDIRDSRLWSFNVAQGVFVSAGQIITGTFSTTRFQNTMTASSSAKTALNAVTFPPLTIRQIRFGVPTAAGPTYNITDWDSVNGVLTTDLMYTETASATTPYQILECYYYIYTGQQEKVTDFLKFISIKDPITGYTLKYGYTRPEIDQMDPQRAYQGQPYWVCQYKVDSQGVPLFELIPNPTTNQRYDVLYQKRGSDLAEGDTLNSVCENAIMELGLGRAAQWALRNIGRYSELKGTDWRFIFSEHKRAFAELLEQAERQDEETFLQNYIPDIVPRFGPIDSNFMQAHDTSFWFGY